MARGLLILSLFAALVAIGCSPARPSAETNYQTVGKDPNRDTERARQDNSKAIDLIAKGNYDEAEKALKESLGADVMFGPAHNNLGKVYYHQARLYLAAWEFEYASKLMPHQPEPKNNLGLVFESAGKLDEAVNTYDAAMKMEPDNPQFIGNLARARIRRGDQGDDVRQLLSKLVMRETRSDWLSWAKEKLSTLPKEKSQ